MSTPHTPAELAELRALARRLAVEAGHLVDTRPEALATSTKSSPTDVVTVMDRSSEELLRERLLATRPDDAILGEEGRDQTGTSGLTWVVDPIDGTVNYLYRIPAYAVSVAVVVGDPRVPGAWHPLAGAVYNPATGDLFHAALGAGSAWARIPLTADLADILEQAARAQGQALAVRPPTTLDRALIGTGFSYSAQIREEQGWVLTRVLPHIRDIRRAGSAALDLCAVAAGQLDGHYERELNSWDVAAGWLIATEAGATVSGWLGREPTDPGIIVATPAVHGPLRDRVEAALTELRTIPR